MAENTKSSNPNSTASDNKPNPTAASAGTAATEPDKKSASPSSSPSNAASGNKPNPAAASADMAITEPDKKSASPDAAPASQVQQELEKKQQMYLEAVSNVYQEGSKRYLQLMSRLAEELHKIQQDAVKSDPSSAFTVEVLRAYKMQDLKAIAEAHRTLTNNIQNTALTANKRIVDAIKAAQSEYAAVCTTMEETLRNSADGYSKAVLQTAKGLSPESFDRNFLTALGQGLLLSALVAPDADQSKAA